MVRCTGRIVVSQIHSPLLGAGGFDGAGCCDVVRIFSASYCIPQTVNLLFRQRLLLGWRVGVANRMDSAFGAAPVNQRLALRAMQPGVRLFCEFHSFTPSFHGRSSRCTSVGSWSGMNCHQSRCW